MKKLLVLALVLSMAAMANATLVSITGPTTLQVDEVGVYTVSYSGTPTLGSFDADIVGDAGVVGGFAIIATGRDTSIDYIGAPVGANANGAEVVINYLTTNVALGADLATFTAVGSAPGQINLTMEGWSFFDAASQDIFGDVVLGGLQVTVVPEPMTLGLLALGGLFIRRK